MHWWADAVSVKWMSLIYLIAAIRTTRSLWLSVESSGRKERREMPLKTSVTAFSIHCSQPLAPMKFALTSWLEKWFADLLSLSLSLSLSPSCHHQFRALNHAQQMLRRTEAMSIKKRFFQQRIKLRRRFAFSDIGCIETLFNPVGSTL